MKGRIVIRSALIHPFRKLKFQIKSEIVQIFQFRKNGELRDLENEMDPRLVLLAHAVCINAVRFGIAIQAVSARFAVNF